MGHNSDHYNKIVLPCEQPKFGIGQECDVYDIINGVRANKPHNTCRIFGIRAVCSTDEFYHWEYYVLFARYEWVKEENLEPFSGTVKSLKHGWEKEEEEDG